ncbi:hypothetical protein DFJ63DRAFT_333542 [Scheffersomyces coipomensis]|uniref:uncharacterized protein n=1 Tax=Scheffersomyces coipomensis TaxID=1788519 RepID=UPI00315DD0B8
MSFLQKFYYDNQFNNLWIDDPFHETVLLENEMITVYVELPRRIPGGLSHNDFKILSDIRVKAHNFDCYFNVLGFSFGFSHIIGLIPFVGPIVDLYLSLLILWKAKNVDNNLPYDVYFIFLINILVNFVFSFFPIIGDIISTIYKPNARNFYVLNRHLARIGRRKSITLERRQSVDDTADETETLVNVEDEPVDKPIDTALTYISEIHNRKSIASDANPVELLKSVDYKFIN